PWSRRDSVSPGRGAAVLRIASAADFHRGRCTRLSCGQLACARLSFGCRSCGSRARDWRARPPVWSPSTQMPRVWLFCVRRPAFLTSCRSLRVFVFECIAFCTILVSAVLTQRQKCTVSQGTAQSVGEGAIDDAAYSGSSPIL